MAECAGLEQMNPARAGAVASRAGLVTDVAYVLARHAVADSSAADALDLAINAVIEAAEELDADHLPSADDLAALDRDLWEPLIRRGQAEGVCACRATPAALTSSLRFLIAGLLPGSRRKGQDPIDLARQVRVLFLEAAANVDAPKSRRDTPTAPKPTSGVVTAIALLVSAA